MEAFIVLYLYAGAVWGLYAMLMHMKFYPNGATWKPAAAFLMNWLGWFVTLPIAIIKLYSGKHDKFFK